MCLYYFKKFKDLDSLAIWRFVNVILKRNKDFSKIKIKDEMRSVIDDHEEEVNILNEFFSNYPRSFTEFPLHFLHLEGIPHEEHNFLNNIDFNEQSFFFIYVHQLK